MDPALRRKLRIKTLILWGFFLILWGFFTSAFILLSIPRGPSPSPEFVVFWVAVMAGMLAVVGLRLTYGLVLAQHRLSSRWPGRWRPRPFPGTPPAPQAIAAPFRYTGRRWKVSVGVLAFVFLLFAFVWLMPASGDEFLDRTLAILRWLVVIFAALAIPVSLLGLRAITFEVDDLGVRVRGRLRPFDIPWDDVSKLEATRYSGFPFSLSDDVKFPTSYALWRKTGTVGGIIAPGAELSQREGAAFEAALIAYGIRRGISVVEIPWQASRVWWRMRERARPADAR
jgi:hypothetical protein